MVFLNALLYIIIAPLVGGIIAGIDRKISARMQGRYGPPLLQPFYDVFKLFSKEVLVVNRAQKFFIMFFFIFMVITGALFFSGGDILLVTFAFTLASIFLVVGAYSTNSPYSSVGAERELLQMMAYEPMVLLTTVGFYLVSGSFNVRDIIAAPVPAIVYLPGVFIGYVFILTIKLRKSPFDLSTSHHGHQEIVKGITTEFTGATLAFVEMAHWYESTLLLGFIFIFFSWNSAISIPIAIFGCISIYFLEILIDNVFARVKWELVLKSSWIVGATLAFINIVVITMI
jgi:ech hydrogenase subunit B